jgi:hypothetical protein
MTTPSLFNAPPLQKPAAPVQAPVQSAAAPAIGAPVPQPAASTLVPLTEDDLKRALPANLRSSVTPSLVSLVNGISSDPVIAEHIRDNIIGYSHIMREGKFKTEDYVNAVAYVSYKLMGYNNEDAYSRTFPQRYATLIARNASKKDISAYVSAYHGGKLVNLIMEQSLVPTWVLNQDIQQKAINHLALLMTTATSEKVQADAAIGLLNHLKKPEPKGDFQIKIDTSETSGMKEMQSMLSKLAQQQRDMIESGAMKTIDVAASKLIQKPAEEDVTDV